MAKKKRQPKKRPKASPKKAPKRQSEPPAGLPDRRALEGLMRGFLGEMFDSAEETPLSQAQDLIYEAFEEPDPGRTRS